MKIRSITSTVLFITAATAASQLYAADYTTTVANANTGLLWDNGSFWTSGAGASAGNNYEALSGSLVRNPRAAIVTFPGASLKIDSGAAMRFKANANTNIIFNDGGLILNGGQAQAGDAVATTVSGFVHVLVASSMATSGPGTILDTPGHAAPDTRTLNIAANVDGSGLLTLMNGKTTIANPSGGGLPDFSFTGTNTSFSGGFLNQGGWLQVAGINSLGSGNVVITGFDGSNQAIFNSTVDLVSSGSLTLSNLNSGLILDKNLTFSAVTINGSSLAPGSYTTTQLTTMGYGAYIAGGSDSTKFLTVLTVVPEPSSTAAFIVTGLATILVLRRKQIRN